MDTSDNPGFEKCCDEHDFCYDTCNTVRSDCDDKFKQCLLKSCKDRTRGAKEGKKKEDYLKGCKNMADTMHSATAGFGCQAYQESQKNACLCDGKNTTKPAIDAKSKPAKKKKSSSKDKSEL